MEQFTDYEDDGDEKGLLRRIGRAMRDPLAGRDVREVVDRNGDGWLYRNTPFQRRAASHAVEGAIKPSDLFGHHKKPKVDAPPTPKPAKVVRTFEGFGTKPSTKFKHKPWVVMGKPMLPMDKPRNTAYTRRLREGKKGDGNYIWQRRRLHRRIIDHIFRPTTAKPKPEGQRTVYFLGGGPGAGKSSLAKSGVVKFPDRADALHLSPDDIKELIPEYQEWVDNGIDAASYVHEESRDIYDLAVHRAIEEGHDMVLDTTGNSRYSKHKKRMRQLHRNGHRIIAHYVTSDIDVALERSHRRREETGRGVPDSQLIHSYGEVARLVPLSLKDKLFDEFYLWDNSVNGQDPVLVAFLDDTGHLVVNDQTKWMKFIRQGARPKPKQQKRPKGTSGRFPGFGRETYTQTQADFFRMLDEQYAKEDDWSRPPHVHRPKPKPDGVPGAGMSSYLGKKADPAGDSDPLEEALAMLGTTSGPDVDDYVNLYADVIQNPKRKPRTALEQYILDEYTAMGSNACDMVFDTPRVVPKRIARVYDLDKRADERGQKDVFSGMVSGGDARPDRMGRVQRDGAVMDETTTRRRRRRLLRERTELAKPTGTMRDILTKRSSDPRAIDAKAFAIAAMWNHSPVAVDIKSGLVGSKDPVVQAVESVVSYGVPGDMSRLRSPVRSTAYRAATPGGGGGGSRAGTIGRAIGRGAAEAMRCPAGYQHGGRFSNRFLNNCGQQLFDVPGNLEQPGAARAVSVIRRTIGDIQALQAGTARAGRVGSGDYTNLGATISRMANVPHVGGLNKRKTDEQVASAIASAAGAKNDFLRLIRRDGVSLDAKVPVKKLADQRKNVDMQDGTIVARVSSLAKMGRDEVGLLGTGIRSLRLVTPGGHEFRLDRTRDLGPSEATAMRREWAAISRRLKDDDGALGLQQLAQAFNGLSYSEKFNDIQNPNEMVRIERNGVERIVPRWAFLTFYGDNAPGRLETGQAWKEVGVVSQANDQAVARNATSLGETVKRLQSGATMDEVASEFLADVANNSKLFKATDMGNGRTLLQRSNGERYIRTEADPKDALTNQVAADVGRALGVPTLPVRVSSTGTKRTTLTQTPDMALPEAKILDDESMNKTPRADLARIALVDYLFGRENRSPGSIALLGIGNNKVIPVPVDFGTPNKSAAVIRKPEEVLTTGNHWTAPHFTAPHRQAQQAIVKMYDNLLDDAKSFDWDAYVARLGLDGQLSPNDKQHLAILRRLYATRVDRLRSGRKTVLRVFGVSE